MSNFDQRRTEKEERGGLEIPCTKILHKPASAFSIRTPIIITGGRTEALCFFLLLTLLLFYIFLLFPLFPPLPVNIIALYSLPPHLVTPPERRVQKEEEPQLGLTRVLGSPRMP
ncbi:hypothetical protein SDJN02_02303, partial [Cucurbita argyrosperma subsp. argyrosperma]